MSGKIKVFIEADLEPIIPRFFELRRADIQTIAESLEKGDFETIKRLGHSMKGSGGGYGFDRISEIGREIEEAAANKDIGRITLSRDELADFLDNVEVVYE